jgi:hypothetical protein
MGNTKVIVTAESSGYMSGTIGFQCIFFDSSNTYLGETPVSISVPSFSNESDIISLMNSAVVSACSGFGFPSPNPIIYTFQINPDWNASSGPAQILNKPTIPTLPQTYQTIISQSGTSAPTTSLSSPTNTYSGTPTFTWARISSGVYTLTASSAVFTAGKTGVTISPLNNLNGAVTAVITSTTVITITTAIQSLAVLGLLGFTATPTDSLITNAMITIQTLS